MVSVSENSGFLQNPRWTEAPAEPCKPPLLLKSQKRELRAQRWRPHLPGVFGWEV